jgi:hypothetical protein
MTADEMDKDLERFTDFEQVSNRVPYWERRLKLTKDADREAFDAIVAKHANRVLGVMRAG